MSPSIDVLQFADDILPHASGLQSSQVSSDLSSAVSSLAEWLKQRGLILNEKKSQVLSLSTPDITVSCRNVKLPNVATARYLGVTLANDLSWRPHVEQRSQAAARSIGVLRRMRNCMTLEARYRFYVSVIMSNLMYGSNAFISNLPCYCCDKLIKLQKKALRAIFGLPYWAHTAPLYVMFNETSIIDKMYRKLAVLVWRAQHEQCSQLLSTLFTTRPGDRTRGSASNTIVLPSARTLSGLHRPSFTGAVVWNALSTDSRLCKRISLFKKSLPREMPRF